MPVATSPIRISVEGELDLPLQAFGCGLGVLGTEIGVGPAALWRAVCFAQVAVAGAALARVVALKIGERITAPDRAFAAAPARELHDRGATTGQPDDVTGQSPLPLPSSSSSIVGAPRS